jgi:membrane protein
MRAHTRARELEARPEPDEAPPAEEEPPPSRRPDAADVKTIAKRAVKQALDDGITDLAAALAYYSFMAIPSVLLVVAGLFTLIASPDGIQTLISHLHGVIPSQATELLNSSLQNLNNRPSTSVVMTVVGFVLALWTATGAMTAFMRALNRAFDRKETRGFRRQRLVALEMVTVMGVAFLLVFGLLVLGPYVSDWIGNAVGAHAVVSVLWWVLQWPVLFGGLLAAFATLLYLGPDVDLPRFRLVTPGAVVAALAWIAVSGLFAVYTSMFSSYNKTWGSLSAVIVMLTWLWLTALALLFGAEVNAEAERSRELRQGQTAAADQIQAPAKA